MRYAVLGIGVLVIILYIAPIFLGLFGLQQYGEYFRPGTILSTVQQISTNLLGGSASNAQYDATLDTNSPSSADFSTL